MHSIRGEPRIQRNTSGEFTSKLSWRNSHYCWYSRVGSV